MKFRFFLFHKTALHIAVEKQNKDVVQLLLACENVDVNVECIFKMHCYL